MKHRFSVIFSYSVGIGMILMWLFFIFSGNVPEFQTKPWEIALHLSAEFLTAICLIAGAIVYKRKNESGKKLMLIAHGMLFYTLIVSPGYYAQSGDFTLVAMFAVLLVLAVISVISLVSNKPNKN